MHKTEQVEKCPICGGAGQHYKRAVDRNWVVNTDKCQECGVVYQNPRLTQNSLIEFYKNGDYASKYGSNIVMQKSRANRFSVILKAMQFFPRRILDIGCGRGYLLKNLQDDYNASVMGLDLFVDDPIVDGIAKTKEEIEGKFDLILCIQTLEHTYDPIEEIKWMLDRLESGGTIMLEIPMLEKIYLPHIYHWNMQSFRLMLDSLGLQYSIIEYSTNVIALIGEGYEKYKADYVVEDVKAFTIFDGIYR